MNKLYICVFSTIISVALSSQVLVLPQNLSEDFNSTFNLALVNTYHGNYLMLKGQDDNNAKFLQIFKIDSQGVITNVSRFDVSPDGQYMTLFTNGKWFGSFYNFGIYLFKLDSNDQPTESRFWNKEGITWVKILSDDTMVIYNTIDFTFQIYKYNATSDAWDQFQKIGPSRVQVGNGIYHAAVDDNYLIYMDTDYNLNIFSRTSNGSFVFEMTMVMDSQYLDPEYSLYFNGNDTIILASSTTYAGESAPGQLIFMTRNTEKWTTNITTEWILPSQIGYVYGADGPLLGLYAFAAVDQDNFVFGAPTADELVPGKRNVEQTQNLGKVLLVQRRNSLNSNSTETRNWIPIIDIDNKKNNYFGAGVMVLGNHIVMTQCTLNGQLNIPCQFWVVPTCIVKPIGVTCATKEFDSCEIDFTEQYFTVSDDLCKNNVDVDISFSDYTFTASYTLDRQFVASERCNATLKCARPVVPVAVPMSTPVTAAPTKATSGSTALFWTASYLSVILIAMLF